MKVALVHNLKLAADEAQAEYDTPATIQALVDAIAAAGHEPVRIEVTGPLPRWLPQLLACRPDLVLNTAEGTRGPARAAFFPALFDSLGLRYAGSDARAQLLTQDKHLTKLAVAAAGVAVVPGAFYVRPRLDPPPPRCPVIVKPNFEGSSKGITEASVVTDPAQLPAALARVLSDYPDGVLVEEYVPGTDVTVGYFQRFSPEILTPCSYLVAPEWANRFQLYDFRLKNVAPDDAVQVACPARVPDDAIREVRAAAARAARALGLRGLARLDFRVRDDGRVFLVEVNATPSLEPGSSIFDALRAEGVDYCGAIRHLLEHAAVIPAHEP